MQFNHNFRSLPQSCIKIFAAFNVYSRCSPLQITVRCAHKLWLFVQQAPACSLAALSWERKTLIRPPLLPLSQFLSVVALLAFKAGSAQYFKPLVRWHTASGGRAYVSFVRNMVGPFSTQLPFRAETQSSYMAWKERNKDPAMSQRLLRQPKLRFITRVRIRVI